MIYAREDIPSKILNKKIPDNTEGLFVYCR